MLALQAVAGPLADITVDVGPYVPRGDQPLCGPDARMRKRVQAVKGTLTPKIKWGSKRSKWCKTNQVAVKTSCVLPFWRNSTPKMVKPRFG